MPEISRFYGIIIYMFFNDHNPPHFHVRYGEFEALIAIADFRILKGKLPPKAIALVVEWATIHQQELIKDWKLTENLQKPEKIPPL